MFIGSDTSSCIFSLSIGVCLATKWNQNSSRQKEFFLHQSVFIFLFIQSQSWLWESLLLFSRYICRVCFSFALGAFFEDPKVTVFCCLSSHSGVKQIAVKKWNIILILLLPNVLDDENQPPPYWKSTSRSKKVKSTRMWGLRSIVLELRHKKCL